VGLDKEPAVSIREVLQAVGEGLRETWPAIYSSKSKSPEDRSYLWQVFFADEQVQVPHRTACDIAIETFCQRQAAQRRTRHTGVLECPDDGTQFGGEHQIPG
jgi:hypothetical protein